MLEDGRSILTAKRGSTVFHAIAKGWEEAGSWNGASGLVRKSSDF